MFYLLTYRCCEIFTSCGLNERVDFKLAVFIPMPACMVWRHDISPTTSSASLIPTAAVSGRRHPHSWWSDVHSSSLLAIMCFWWLEAASGTVCRPMSPHFQRWLLFGTDSKLISFPDNFLPNCFQFLVLYTLYSSGLAVLYSSHSI